mgnify:CR=1 FL=1
MVAQRRNGHKKNFKRGKRLTPEQDEKKREEIFIISQGKEYTISGEVVDIKFEDND